MIDLIEEAKKAGYAQTDWLRRMLSDAATEFIHIVADANGELIEEEEDALREAFYEGFHQ